MLEDREKKILEEINEEQDEVAHPRIYHNCIDFNKGKTLHV
jgi:hypothetical protein